MNYESKISLLYASCAMIMAVLLFIGGLLGYAIGHRDVITITTVEEERPLSEWDILQLALIKTECEGDSLAIGAIGDAGIYQITPIYVEEVNRIAGTEYDPSDALNPVKAKEMFNIYQTAKNPEHDIDKAIRLHNPKGGVTYSKKVKRNMGLFRTWERYRNLIKD